ncbi:hypothetical protein HKX48_006458 [Thoreauomyces humboldtii]|nr:hypothetical protein HKX48_006458 [Thoreauomyces humboldtii]
MSAVLTFVDTYESFTSFRRTAMEADRELCLLAGMNGHISKPVKLKTLARMIELHGAPRIAAKLQAAASQTPTPQNSRTNTTESVAVVPGVVSNVVSSQESTSTFDIDAAHPSSSAVKEGPSFEELGLRCFRKLGQGSTASPYIHVIVLQNGQSGSTAGSPVEGDDGWTYGGDS